MTPEFTFEATGNLGNKVITVVADTPEEACDKATVEYFGSDIQDKVASGSLALRPLESVDEKTDEKVK